jgi:HD-GYP domain-containing protein (c-di-GMP phosphodiesterase class II)
MTTNRSYQNAKTPQEAMLELKRCAGTQFDPNLVKSFIELMELEELNNVKHTS